MTRPARVRLVLSEMYLIFWGRRSRDHWVLRHALILAVLGSLCGQILLWSYFEDCYSIHRIFLYLWSSACLGVRCVVMVAVDCSVGFGWVERVFGFDM